MLEYIATILISAGGAAGILALYNKARDFFVKPVVKVVYASFFEDKQCSLTFPIKLFVYNPKSEPISVLDSLLTLQYDLELVGKKDKANVFSSKDQFMEMSNIFPVNIPPKETREIQLSFNFKNIDLKLVERELPRHHLGFLNGKTDFVVKFSSMKKDSLEKCPIVVLLTLDFNDFKKRQFLLEIYNNSIRLPQGALNTNEIKRIEFDYLNNPVKRKTSEFSNKKVELQLDEVKKDGIL